MKRRMEKVESEKKNFNSRYSQVAEILQTFRRVDRYGGSEDFIKRSQFEDEGYGFPDTSGS